MFLKYHKKENQTTVQVVEEEIVCKFELLYEADAQVQKTLKISYFLACATPPSSSVKMAKKCDFSPFLTFVRSTTARLKNELFRDVQWSLYL